MAYEHARWPVLTNDERSRWPCIPRRHWRDNILELWGNDAIIREPQYLLLVTDASTLEIIMHLSDANTLGPVERMYLMRLRDEITAETNTSFLVNLHPAKNRYRHSADILAPIHEMQYSTATPRKY